MPCAAVRRVEVRVPASTSNLGPGFDAMGMALTLYNEFLFERLESGIQILVRGEGAECLKEEASNRTYQAFCAANQALRRETPGVRIVQHNRIPLARGLGGSGTSALAGTLAAFLFAGVEPESERILAQAVRVEGHPDNVTPSLVGGLTVSALDGPRVAYVKVIPPVQLTAVVLIPDRPLDTGLARQVLPGQYAREDMIFNIRGAAMVMAALATGQLEHLALAMRDRLHQPYRAPLLPGMANIFEAALEAGALGTALSGAGSGILALSRPDRALTVGQAMQEAARRHGMGSYSLQLSIDTEGAQIHGVA